MPAHVFHFAIALATVLFCSNALSAWSPLLREGDIVVADGPTSRSIATSEDSQLWPAGVIPYQFDPSLPEASIQAIERAISRWNTVPGIRLLPVEDVDSLAAFSTRDSVEFVVGEFCASWVGRRGGVQKLWVSANCQSGGVMHEIGHLVGLEHEHTRADRDQFIQIHWENIESSKRHNFDAAPAGVQLIGDYDYASLMHYGTTNFSSNGLPTISRLDGSDEEIGQRRQLSIGDMQALNTLYGTDLSVVTRNDNELGVVDIYVSNDTLRGAQFVSVDIPLELLLDDWRGRASYGDWNCLQATIDFLTCSLDRLPGGAVEQLSFPLSGRATLESLVIALRSETPDHDMQNNSSRTLASLNDNMQSTEEPQLMSAMDLAASVDEILPKLAIQQDGTKTVTTGASGVFFLYLSGLVLLLKRQAGRRVYRGILALFSRIG